MTLFAGVDVGTGGVRCLVVDERGARAGFGSRAWTYDADESGWPTIDPARAMRLVDEAIAEASEGRALAAIGVTSQRTGVVLLSEDGRELLVSPNTDGRAAMHGVAIERAHGEAIYRVAGRLPAMLYLPARLAHYREQRDAGKVAFALSLADWVVYRLTSAVATDITQAAELGLLDVAERAWSIELCTALDIEATVLPPIIESGAPAGGRNGVPVVPAGTDSQSAALALGVTQPGEAFVVAGTTMICEQVVSHPISDPQRIMWLSPHHLRDAWVHEAHCGEAGAAAEWLARIMSVSVAELAASAERGIAGAGGISFVDSYPSIASDFTLVRTGGVLFNAPVLALGRDSNDVARALHEGIAFGARAGLDLLRDLDGEPSSIAAGGGVTQSAVFARALAGASRRPVVVATEPASSSLGAAIVAASSHHGGLHEAVVAMRDRGREVAPDLDDGYPSHYALWRQRAEMLATRSTRVSDLMR